MSYQHMFPNWLFWLWIKEVACSGLFSGKSLSCLKKKKKKRQDQTWGKSTEKMRGLSEPWVIWQFFSPHEEFFSTNTRVLCHSLTFHSWIKICVRTVDCSKSPSCYFWTISLTEIHIKVFLRAEIKSPQYTVEYTNLKPILERCVRDCTWTEASGRSRGSTAGCSVLAGVWRDLWSIMDELLLNLIQSSTNLKT